MKDGCVAREVGVGGLPGLCIFAHPCKVLWDGIRRYRYTQAAEDTVNTALPFKGPGWSENDSWFLPAFRKMSHDSPGCFPGRGICSCSRCWCNADYEGTACQCQKSTSRCLNNRMVECSGHGRCYCNRCYCDPGYLPPLCEECPGCVLGCYEY